MTLSAAQNPPRRHPLPAWLRDVAAVCMIMVLAITVEAAKGFPTLGDAGGDNDSLLRLVTVRDLLAGQGWFDPVQYRMGLEGGFAMHWSRLVDAPIAALTLIAGETAARIIWPTLLLGLSMLAILAMARRAYGPSATLPAAAIGAAALLTIGIFSPGALDHHNAQVALTLWMCAGLAVGSLRAAFGAGLAAAAMMAIAAESLPLIAAGGAFAACAFAARGGADRTSAIGFGLGFAIGAALGALVTIPLASWLTPVCDAYSVAQFAVAVPAGLGLAGIAFRLPALSGIGTRTAALALLGLGLAILVALAFPQCLSDPYAGLDPRLRAFWLDGVTEAQSLLSILRSDPAMAATWYATPLIAMTILAVRLMRGEADRVDATVATVLAIAFAVSLWQVRGAVFAVPLAVVPLAGWIARRREAAISGGAVALAAMMLAWIVSVNGLWTVAARAATQAVQTRPAATETMAAPSEGLCYHRDDYAELSALPPQTVVSVSNLGSAILAHTPHRVLAGPYHRNVDGNLAALDIFLADVDDSERLARTAGVGIVAVCSGNSEWRVLTSAAPRGLAAALASGAPPAWLTPTTGNGDGKALRLYRVTPQ